MTERLIELRGIGKRYGVGEAAFNALTNVDLSIDQGEFVAIMGPSGSGKSTMMNIIGALDSPSSGQYLFKGLHVETLTRSSAARAISCLLAVGTPRYKSGISTFSSAVVLGSRLNP